LWLSSPPTTIDFPDFSFRNPFYFLHSDEALVGTQGPLTAVNWSSVGGAVWARKTYQRSKSVPNTVAAEETTTLDLVHTPEE